MKKSLTIIHAHTIDVWTQKWQEQIKHGHVI